MAVIELILGLVLVCASLGVLLFQKPVHASLSFLLVLFTLSIFYIQLSAQFIGVMQLLIYAGAILVIFMFVIILFQDAHAQIANFSPQSLPSLILTAAFVFVATFALLATRFFNHVPNRKDLPDGFGTVQALGKALYLDTFFPFEAVILLFLVAAIGAFYIGKKRDE